MEAMQIVGLVDSLELLEVIKSVRNQVFVQEQEIDSTLEFDANDIQFKEGLENSSLSTNSLLNKLRYYYIKLNGDDGEVCGTCRARKTTDSTWKIERVATLKNHRGKGLGQSLISFVIDDLSKLDDSSNSEETTFYIHAQLSAYPFWSRGNFNNGKFIKVGEDFEEASIPHCKMIYHPNK